LGGSFQVAEALPQQHLQFVAARIRTKRFALIFD
jgi:hypothetical protein